MKHAFLILAHKNFHQLDTLIGLLDHPRTDIFIHVDKRSPSYSPPKCNYSRVIMLERMRTNWGGYSLVECELRLLEKALETDCYSFIHLLSGQDLPIKPIDELLSFFDSHSSNNFVHFDKPDASKERNKRVKYYYVFQDIKPNTRSIWGLLQRGLVLVQKCFFVDRTKKYTGEFKAGSQWWSINPQLAKYIVSERDKIFRLFKYTMSDEMFVQTLVYNSSFYSTLYIKEEDDIHGNQRLLYFSNGTPHIWNINDKDVIQKSDLLFARKFDEQKDSRIIDEVIKIVSSQ